AVARTLRVSDDDAIYWCLFPPDSAETNSYHLYISKKWSRVAAGSSRHQRFRRAPAFTSPHAEHCRHPSSALRHLLHHLLHLAELPEKLIHFTDCPSGTLRNSRTPRSIQH